MIPVGVGIQEVDWYHVLSVVATATLISFLKSIVVSMPEVALAKEVEEQNYKLKIKENLDDFT